MSYSSRYGHERTRTADGSRRRDQRRDEAEARQAKRNERTPQQQIELLDRKFGKNTGATKERIRLHSLITETQSKNSRAKKDWNKAKDAGINPMTRRKKKKARRK